MKRILIVLSLLVLLLLSLSSCRRQIRFEQPIPVDSTMPQGDATEVENKRFHMAFDYSAHHKGVGLLVIRDGKIIFEKYHDGYNADTPVHIFSGTKSFSGILAIAAIADGLITLDEKICDTIPEFREDPRKSQITVAHLLNFTSGIEQNWYRLSIDGMVVPEQQRIKNKYEYSLSLDADSDPGKTYKYGSSHLMVFGEFIKRKLKQDPLDYLDQRIFSAIHFQYSGWHKDPTGNSMLPYGAWTTAREWAKLGTLIINDGEYRGKQVIPKGLLAQCFQGSDAMPAYGLTFWLNREVPQEKRKNIIPVLRETAKMGKVLYPEGAEDLVAAAGHNNNRLYIIPSEKMIIVRTGMKSRKFRDEKFLAQLLHGRK